MIKPFCFLRFLYETKLISIEFLYNFYKFFMFQMGHKNKWAMRQSHGTTNNFRKQEFLFWEALTFLSASINNFRTLSLSPSTTTLKSQPVPPNAGPKPQPVGCRPLTPPCPCVPRSRCHPRSHCEGAPWLPCATRGFSAQLRGSVEEEAS